MQCQWCLENVAVDRLCFEILKQLEDIVICPPQILLLLSLCNKTFFVVLLVLVSSCPDGELSCTSGECLPGGLICDLKTDCESGSDQEFCGKLLLLFT